MTKIYGIDLGTTNSLIGLGDQLLSELVPSVASIEKKLAGEEVFEDLTATRSFKINISLGLEGNLSVAASKLVLAELRHQAGGDVVKKAVISVPAYFSDNQRQATMKAADMAGLEVVGLINEPTAAAIFISRKRKALSLVYDLGGGTFDVSVIDSRFDSYDVQATDGSVVGGDNLDVNIMRHLIKEGEVKRHTLGKDGLAKLQRLASNLKVRMQEERKDLIVSLQGFGAGEIVFKEEVYIELMKMTFAETIIKTRKVISEAIPVGEKFDFVLVGGSTRCPFLREWITREFGQSPVELTYDPDKAVAQGAAMYAAMLESGEAEEAVSDVTKALSIEMNDGTVRPIIMKNSKIPVEETTVLYNSVASQLLRVNLYQGDSLLAKSNECIGTLVYDYGHIVSESEGEVIVTVSVESSGIIRLSCKELLKESVEIVLDRKSVK